MIRALTMHCCKLSISLAIYDVNKKIFFMANYSVWDSPPLFCTSYKLINPHFPNQPDPFSLFP